MSNPLSISKELFCTYNCHLHAEALLCRGSRFSFLIPLALPGTDVVRVGSGAGSLASGHSSAQSTPGQEIESLVEALASATPMSTEHLASTATSPSPSSSRPGSFRVTDSNLPIRAVRIDEYSVDSLSRPRLRQTPSQFSVPLAIPPVPPSLEPPKPVTLRILIVEVSILNIQSRLLTESVVG